MSFQQLFETLQNDTLKTSLPYFKPELAICATIVLMLLVRVFNLGRREDAFFIALAGSLIGLVLANPWTNLGASELVTAEIFTGLLKYDPFTVYFRALLLFFAVLFIVFTRLSGIPDKEDGPDFYTLILGSILGMCLMASANHLLMVFLGVEMASVPSYALAGMLKGRRQSSEAALKYAVYGAGAAGVMLYGISLLSGVLGSAHLPTMAGELARILPDANLADRGMVLALGGLMLAAGLAFKLSAVPFHFWCPDVFEGASAEVNAFLSVASKAAALALLVRVAVGFSHLPVEPKAVSQVAPEASVEAPVTDVPAPIIQPATQSKDLQPARNYIVGLISLLSAITATFGNLAAYGQTNIKRLLAYSTIAHAGLMMMPVAAAVQLLSSDPEAAEEAVAAVCLYAGMYLFMNLGAFAVVAFVRNELRSEEIADYAGLIRRWPGVALCMSIIFLSLLGLPPLAGLWAKVVVFKSLISAELLLLALIGGLNSVISLFYYLRVVKVMLIDEAPESARDTPALPPLAGMYIAAVTIPLLILGIWWDGLNSWALAAAEKLLT